MKRTLPFCASAVASEIDKPFDGTYRTLHKSRFAWNGTPVRTGVELFGVAGFRLPFC